MNNLETKIEALLFFKAEPVSLKKLEDLLKVSKTEILEALESLKNNLSNRGIVLMEKDEEYTIAVSPVYSDMIEEIQKEELNRDLSKASLETLSIILYKNGASRSEIDFIRGVNSSFTLRALLVRGLVEKVVSNEDNRKYVYKPTFDLLSFMGVSNISELPGWEELNSMIEKTIIENNEEEIS
ncbi:MAG: SMC-Scp complex subunit ScpB [Candidatus Paceibacterota bacterium]